MAFNPNFDNLGQFTGQKKIFQVRRSLLNGFTINTKKEPVILGCPTYQKSL